MSFVNIFCGKKGNGLEKRNEVQSPLISGTEDASAGPILRTNKASRYLSSNTQKNTLKKSAMTSSSMRLSVTDLLEQVEQQTEMFSKLFPLIDKEKYKKKSKSTSSDSDLEFPFEQRYQKDTSKGKIVQQRLSTETESSSSLMHDSISHEDGATCSYLQKDDSTNDPALMITNTLQPPEESSAELRGLSSRRPSSAWFGVHIEYLILDNKLKVSVHRIEDESSEKERKRRFAKLYLMPGNLQCQKVNITTGTGISPIQQSAYFSGINGSDLIKMEVGVAIYMKQGLLRKDKLISEWFVPMRMIDLMEPQTAWRMC